MQSTFVLYLCGTHYLPIFVANHQEAKEKFFLGVTIWLGEGIAFARKAVVTNHRQKEHSARSTDISRESKVLHIIIHVPKLRLNS